ncbi:hypothetical protein [Lactococcus lactis]|nr:hypothetical protein [Lactococcus lactis]
MSDWVKLHLCACAYAVGWVDYIDYWFIHVENSSHYGKIRA